MQRPKEVQSKCGKRRLETSKMAERSHSQGVYKVVLFEQGLNEALVMRQTTPMGSPVLPYCAC
jgi:hypothetical protein